MKIGNILLTAAHEFNNRFQSGLYRKVHIWLVGVFTFLVFVMWPGGMTLTYRIPQRFDVGYTILLILGIVFITQYLTSFNNDNNEFSGIPEIRKKISLRENIIGQSLAAVFLLFIYVITLLPHGVLLYYSGYFKLNHILLLYGIILMLVTAFVMFESIITFMIKNEITAAIIRIVVSAAYVAGLIFTMEPTAAQIYLYLPFHLAFTGIIGFIYVFMIALKLR